MEVTKYPFRAARSMSVRGICYDVLFLDVLVDSKGKGSRVFSDLFRNNDPLLLFKFLSEKTNIFEEIRIFISVDIVTFVKSLFKRIKSVYLKDFLKS